MTSQTKLTSKTVKTVAINNKVHRLAGQVIATKKTIDLASTISNLKSNLLLLTWLISVFCLLFLNFTLKHNSTRFFGIAENQEQSISFQYPVEIIKISIIEGEKVDKDTILLTVHRHDLKLEQAIIDNNIQEIKSRHHESLATTRAELEDIHAQQRLKLAEIETRIHSLESRHQLNQNLLNIISDASNNSMKKTSKVSPLYTELLGLKRERDYIKQSRQAQIDNLESRLLTETRPATIQISKLEERKTELQRQSAGLTVKANFDGNIGSIKYKEGEQVPPFQTILTLHTSSPNLIKAYIHEDIQNKISLGQSVWLQPTSANNKEIIIEGTVESLGNRIVEYPSRLKRNRIVSAWGREVIIKLPEDSPLLLGEKVMILLEKPFSIYTYFIETISSTSNTYANRILKNDPKQKTITLNTTHSFSKKENTEHIEASGLTWHEHTNSFFLVSDETFKLKPLIYELDTEGRLISTLPIINSNNIDDMESISHDKQHFYTLSSLSHNKKGKLKSKRRKLLRLKLVEHHFEVNGEIDLYKVLTNTIKYNINNKTQAYLKSAIKNKTINIEAHTVIDNTLYIGFKTPLDKLGNTVIAKIHNLSSLFNETKTTVEIWQTLPLTDPDNNQTTLLTDMAIYKNHAYLLSINNNLNHTNSHLWKLNLTTHKLSHITSFQNINAEGLAIQGNSGKAMIAIDTGNSGKPQLLITEID